MDGYVGVLKARYSVGDQAVQATAVATVQVPYGPGADEGPPEAQLGSVFFQEISIATGF